MQWDRSARNRRKSSNHNDRGRRLIALAGGRGCCRAAGREKMQLCVGAQQAPCGLLFLASGQSCERRAFSHTKRRDAHHDGRFHPLAGRVSSRDRLACTMRCEAQAEHTRAACVSYRAKSVAQAGDSLGHQRERLIINIKYRSRRP